MRTNKIAIKYSSVISVTALVLSIVLYSKGYDYASNLLVGVFASGVLTLLISLINYSTERRRTLEKFYSYALKAASNFNRFENDNSLERTIDIVLQMNQFDYIELDNSFGDIDFFFNNKKNREFIYENIYEPTVNLRRIINEKCFHFNEYRKAVNGNSLVMQRFVKEIDSFIMSRSEDELTLEDGTTTIVVTCYNKIVKGILDNVNGRFYKMIYPNIKIR